MTCLLPSGRIASTCIDLPRRWKCGWKLSMSAYSFRTVTPAVLRIELVGIVIAQTTPRPARRAGVDGLGIVHEHEMRDRVVNDLAGLKARGTNLHEPDPPRLSERDLGHRAIPDVLVLGRHRVLRRPDDEVRLAEAVAHGLPLVVGDERPGRRQIVRIALWRARAHPADDHVHLLVSQRHVVLEFLDANALVDVPRRQLPRRHALL